mmetsp:Transcript_15276/g.43713  ORF Transcript_15276/g.43713 Transcript_15276/m.43713 type:complete len:272 (-) Transcript_15276:335-1150(-)
MRRKRRPSARATDSPREVLPMPGGPSRHRTGPAVLPRSFCTARNSRSRLLTVCSPKWSSSRLALAASRSCLSTVQACQGRLASVSTYWCATAYSGCSGCIAFKRFISRCAILSASPARPALETFTASCSTSSSSAEPGPSSRASRPAAGFWLWWPCTSCCPPRTGQAMPGSAPPEALWRSVSARSSRSTCSRRCLTSTASSTSWRCSSEGDLRAAPTASASLEADLGHRACCWPPGAESSRRCFCTRRDRLLTAIPSTSGPGSGSSRTVAR